ncbi:hypothetical protein [Lysinibacillus sphaericus]|uniref:hypothetical protein n=1 Tax=Lysinibacillus sphaericus TaxID=1421 RepID=UPI003D03DEFB
MANVKGITIELGLSDQSVLKLRAIAKHAGALADELDAIDNSFTINELREQHGLNPIQDGDKRLCKRLCKSEGSE